MANSSWFNTSNNNIKYRIEVTQNSQSMADNASNVTVKVFVKRNDTGHISSGAGTIYCKIDGSVYSASISRTQQITESGIYLFSRTLNIAHDWYGNKDLDCSAWATHSAFNCGEQRFTTTLTSIPRKNTISNVSGGTIGEKVTVSVTRTSDKYTSSAWVSLGDSGWVNVATKVTYANIEFILPMELCNYLTNAESGSGLIRIRTYDGDTEIGDYDVSHTFTIPNSVVPSISQVSLDSDTKIGDWHGLIQTKSKLRIRPTSQGSYGSTITSIRVEFDGSTYWGSDVWTNVITTSGNRPVNITVWDSRGRSVAWSGSVTVEAYRNPRGTLSAYRCDSNGNRNDSTGDKVKVTYSGNIASISGHNTISIKVDHRIKGESWSTLDVSSDTEANEATVIINNMSLESSHEVRLRVTDNYTTATYTTIIDAALVIMDLKRGGKGIAFGKISTMDSMEVGMTLNPYENIVFTGSNIDHEIRKEGAPAFIFFNNDWCGYWDDNISSTVWYYDYHTQVLSLKSGYTSSDRRKKYNIDEFTNWDDFYSFYMSLKPVTFKYNNDKLEDTHIGFIAQDVAESIVNNNLVNDKLSIVKRLSNNKYEDGMEYQICYQEMIALNTKMIQKQEEEIRELKETIAQLKSIINKEDADK